MQRRRTRLEIPARRTVRPGAQSGDLTALLRSIDGAGYPAYRSLRGRYPIAESTLDIQHVQPDPFAPPSRISIEIPIEATGLQSESESRLSKLATEDFLSRAIDAWLRSHEDVGGIVRIDPAVQQILDRSAVDLLPDRLELRLTAALPARGRRIEGRRAALALVDGIGRLLRETTLRGAWDAGALGRHRAAVEDHAALTRHLSERGWVAFIADGSRLARASGELDRPLEEGNIPFVAPAEYAATVELPHAGTVRGTAIPRGITLLCGGGFHGKSTLLRALGVSVYPHIPGDGRERIAVDPTAMAIRAEDGRAIRSIDLRPFLRSLPTGDDLSRFTTGNASGSTSQAAAIMEALAIGSRCLLIDEDSSATNFLLRDPWMSRLLRDDQEPIVPLLARLREIYERFGVSTVLVVGGSGEAFRVADRVILMDAYRPLDATPAVLKLRGEMGPGITAPPVDWPMPPRSLPLGQIADRSSRIRPLDATRIRVGKSEIDLGSSRALVHPSQVRTLATILGGWFSEGRETVALPDAAARSAERIDREGPSVYSAYSRGDLAEVRAQEVAMLFDRLRYPTNSPSNTDEGTPDREEG